MREERRYGCSGGLSRDKERGEERRREGKTQCVFRATRGRWGLQNILEREAPFWRETSLRQVPRAIPRLFHVFVFSLRRAASIRRHHLFKYALRRVALCCVMLARVLASDGVRVRVGCVSLPRVVHVSFVPAASCPPLCLPSGHHVTIVVVWSYTLGAELRSPCKLLPYLTKD